MSSEPARRPYRLKERAEAQERTRLRITEAAVDLHGTIGPVRTTISAIAERAGVQRGTVYRHFPDEAAIYAACSGHWNARHPPPDPEPWAAVGDPQERLATALEELYGWYRSGEAMLGNLLRDEPHVPALQEVLAGFHGYLDAVAELLLAGRGLRPGRRRARVAAALRHALAFGTWRSLAAEGLDDAEVRHLAVALVAAASTRPTLG